ncbi:hypothetical protein M8360_33660, partial [Klebsiella pneumoniae]|nr:hypothetical protein [Klebsiella pneumoniae]
GKDPAWDVRIVAMTGSSSLFVVSFVCASESAAAERLKPHRSSSGNHIRSRACATGVMLGHVADGSGCYVRRRYAGVSFAT